MSRPTCTALALSLLVASPVLAAHPGRANAQAAADSSSSGDAAEHLAGLSEQVTTMQGDLDKLKRIKISAYAQARFDASQASADTVKVAGDPNARGLTLTPANLTRFYIREARLKLTYDSSPLSQFVLQLDGSSDRAFRLIEAYVTLFDPWTAGHVHSFTAGQFNVPFGYEIERSSSVRELPERSRAENVLFPGERDRGAMVNSKWPYGVTTVVGVLNGPGINSPDFPATDPTKDKDWVGRVRVTQGTVDLAVSGYAGHALTPLTGPDVETRKTRLGADAQVYYGLPHLGGGTLRGELYRGKEVDADSVKALIATVRDASGAATARLLKPGADGAHLATDFLGWYAMWVQDLGDRLQVVARYDAYDPNTDAGHDQFQRVSVGANAFYDGNTRLTVAYDLPRTSVYDASTGRYADVKDNLLTLQLQHKS